MHQTSYLRNGTLHSNLAEVVVQFEPVDVRVLGCHSRFSCGHPQRLAFERRVDVPHLRAQLTLGLKTLIGRRVIKLHRHTHPLIRTHQGLHARGGLRHGISNSHGGYCSG